MKRTKQTKRHSIITPAAALLALAIPLSTTACGIELGGGHVVVDIVCDPPVTVSLAYQPVVGLPTVTAWRYDFDVAEWLNANAKGAARDLVPILVAAAQGECEGLEL